MNIKLAIPVLHVSEIKRALEFFCDKLGFSKEWSYTPDQNSIDPTYAALKREGSWIHISSFPGDGVSGAVTNFIVSDVDALHQEFKEKGIEFVLEPYDQTWGNREMYLNDPDGNKLRFVQEK